MSVVREDASRGGVLSYRITGAASTADAGLGSIANPEGVPLLILRATFHFITKSAGAANLSVGVTTAAAAATDILNALAVGGVTNDTVYNGFGMQNTAKTEITAPAIWTAAKYITLTGSVTTVGLDAVMMLEYVRLGA